MALWPMARTVNKPEEIPHMIEIGVCGIIPDFEFTVKAG